MRRIVQEAFTVEEYDDDCKDNCKCELVTLSDKELLDLRRTFVNKFDAFLDTEFPTTPRPVGELLAELAEEIVAEYLERKVNG